MKREFKANPLLRSKFIASDGREFDLPAAFEWLDGRKMWAKLYNGDTLKAQQCRDLWAWIGRTDKPPKRLTIYVCKEDLERLLPQPEDSIG